MFSKISLRCAATATTQCMENAVFKCDPVHVCKTCKCVFVSDRKRSYCNEKCAASYYVKKGYRKATSISLVCLHCNEEFFHNQLNGGKSIDRKFCSVRCSNLSRCHGITTYKKQCESCSTEFKSIYKNAKYCRADCRLNRYRTCRSCGNRFPRPDDYSYQCKICTDNKSEFVKQSLARQCLCCGNAITFKTSDSHKVRETRIYCSSQCRSFSNPKAAKTVVKKTEKTLSDCVVCGSRFEGPKNKKYCSYECSYEIHSLVPKIDKTCKNCGTSFVAVSSRIYCSNKCSKQVASRIGKSQRRARIKLVDCERFDPRDVLELYDYKCYLCGVDTPKILRGSYNDNAPELDHIIALANGGSHTVMNTACACRKCNQMKAANDNYIPISIAA